MAFIPRAATLRLDVAGLSRPVSRLIRVPTGMRLWRLHEHIQWLLAWDDASPHVFTDSSDSLEDRNERSGYRSWGPVPRVWEMDHECRDRAGHTSECEWTATVGSAFDAFTHSASPGAHERPTLHYEYGMTKDCPFDRNGEPCVITDLGVHEGDDDDEWADERFSRGQRGHAHGWLISLTLERIEPVRGLTDDSCVLLGGVGGAPLEASGNASTFNLLLDVLERPTDARHAEIESWIRRRLGPWATGRWSAFDPVELETTPMSHLSQRTALQAIPPSFGSAARAALIAAIIRATNAQAGAGDLREEALNDADAARLAGPLLDSLRAIPSTRAADADRPPVDIPAWHERLLRDMNLAYRKGGGPRRSRRGDEVLEQPALLFERAAERYWRRCPDRAVALFVALGVTERYVGDALTDYVAAARNVIVSRRFSDDIWGPAFLTSERSSAPEPDVAEHVAFLAQCGGLGNPLEGEDIRRFARFLLSR